MEKYPEQDLSGFDSNNCTSKDVLWVHAWDVVVPGAKIFSDPPFLNSLNPPLVGELFYSQLSPAFFFQVRCTWCHGSGRRTEYRDGQHHHVSCTWCHGSGRRM